MTKNSRAGQIAMLTGGVAFALVLGALGFQYIGGIVPCEMCHWQRWPHIAAALVGLGGGFLVNAGFIDSHHARALAWAAILLVAISGVIGAYQTGMQFHILPGPSACTGLRFVLGSNMVPQVQCDFVTWQLFGLSLAAYNSLISLGTAALAFLLLRKSQ